MHAPSVQKSPTSRAKNAREMGHPATTEWMLANTRLGMRTTSISTQVNLMMIRTGILSSSARCVYAVREDRHGANPPPRISLKCHFYWIRWRDFNASATSFYTLSLLGTYCVIAFAVGDSKLKVCE